MLYTQESFYTKPREIYFLGLQIINKLYFFLPFYLLEPCKVATVVNFRHRFIVKLDLQSSDITTTYNYTQDNSALSYSELLTTLS